MQVSTLSADPEAIRIISFISNEDSISVLAQTSRTFAICPVCNIRSNSLHSNYLRQVSDLPWHGVAIRIHLNTRKFRCRNDLCLRKVFCDRLPKVVESYGRKTIRLQELFGILAFALGGEAGAKTARQIGLDISGDKLLRRIRRTSILTDQPVKVLGVDDFAFRRGERYGTILVDLEKRKPIDLLSDREAATLTEWLKQHPEIEIISRDRAGCYAVGAKAGAPQAVQVADRFHLLKNLLDGFERFLSRHHQVIAEVFQKVFPSTGRSPKETKPLPSAAKTLEIEQKAARTAIREKRFQIVKQLHREGMPILAIARRLKMSRNTVKRFLSIKSVLERQPNCPRFSPIQQFLPYLQKRWIKEGERSSRALWKEIKTQGYPGAEGTLRHFLQKWREADEMQIRMQTVIKANVPGRAPSIRQVKWLLFGKQVKPKEQWEELFLQQLCQDVPEIEIGQKLVKEFHQLMTERQLEGFKRWLEKARANGIGELIWFANGVEQDRRPVEKAFEIEWSQGQTEGQVNRLKFLKRQMYGRANFDLLRARVIYQS
jgi:transposase